jgi:hypothetical protein
LLSQHLLGQGKPALYAAEKKDNIKTFTEKKTGTNKAALASSN